MHLFKLSSRKSRRKYFLSFSLSRTKNQYRYKFPMQMCICGWMASDWRDDDLITVAKNLAKKKQNQQKLEGKMYEKSDAAAFCCHRGAQACWASCLPHAT